MSRSPLHSAVLTAFVSLAGVSLSACSHTTPHATSQTAQIPATVTGAQIQAKQSNQAQVFSAIDNLHNGLSDMTAINTYNRVLADEVADSARPDFATWLKGRYQNKATQARENVAGQLARTPKKGKARSIVVDANGLEYDQLIKKGLIGAYQFNNVSKELAKLQSGRADNDQVLANITAYLLGDYSELADGKGTKAYAGNEFEKYLKVVAKDKDFHYIEDEVYAQLNVAKQNLNNQKAFNSHIMNAVSAAQKALAVRAIYYLSYGVNLEDATEASEFGNIAHAVSEGLGMLYSLQYTYNPNTGRPYFTQDEVERVINNIDLWEREDASNQLSKTAVRIFQKFGFDVSDADS